MILSNKNEITNTEDRWTDRTPYPTSWNIPEKMKASRLAKALGAPGGEGGGVVGRWGGGAVRWGGLVGWWGA